MDLFLILIAFLLVLLNGFFVASEFAIVKLRRTRVEAIKKLYGIRGRLLGKVHAHLDAYLSACQLGITLSSLGLGWIGEPAFARLLEPVFAVAGITSARVIEVASFAIAFFIISYLHIVIGELAPKSMAIRRPESMSLWTATPLYIFYWTMYPAIWVLNASANWILKKAGLDAHHEHEANYSAEELKLILSTSRAPGKFTNEEWRVLAHAIEFSEMSVDELLRPASELIALYSDQPLEQNLRTIREHRFSRYPFIDHDTGQVLGLLHVKEFVLQGEVRNNEDLKALLNPALLVDEKMPATELLRRFRKGAPHLAIVPGLGTVEGFVTFDNLLAAFFGDIQDEFRRKSNDWERSEGGALVGKASLPVFTLERALGIEISSRDFDSVGGLIMGKLQRLPEKGEKISFEQFDMIVTSMRGPRILTLKIVPKPQKIIRS